MLTLTVQGKTVADLVAALIATADAMSPPAMSAPVADAPAPPKENIPAPEKPAAPGNAVVGAETPAEQRTKGIDLLMTLFNKDQSQMPVLTRLQNKYGVKKFADIPDAVAADFYHDAVLAANGTAETTKD